MDINVYRDLAARSRRLSNRRLWARMSRPDLLMLVLICCLAGCGQKGPRRYDVQGTVTLDGKPVPAGEVQFEPDAQQGNRGPQSRAKIQDGKYRTPGGKGPVAGPAVVRIRCFDGVTHPESPMGTRIGRPYETKIELPDEDSTQDFDVPASHLLQRQAP